jgi:hypothetical protein
MLLKKWQNHNLLDMKKELPISAIILFFISEIKSKNDNQQKIFKHVFSDPQGPAFGFDPQLQGVCSCGERTNIRHVDASVRGRPSFFAFGPLRYGVRFWSTITANTPLPTSMHGGPQLWWIPFPVPTSNPLLGSNTGRPRSLQGWPKYSTNFRHTN